MKKLICFLTAIVIMSTLFTVCPDADSKNDVNIKIISFGDSITASGVWQKQIDQRLGTSIVNMGVSGENSADGLKRLDALLAAEPDIAIIMFGGNDSAIDMAKGMPIEDYISNMRKMITACQSNGIKVIAIMQSYFEAEPYYTRHKKETFDAVGGIEAFMDSYIEAYRALATELGVTIADVRTLCDAYQNRSEILADGVHPNEKGYMLYAKAVGDAIIGLYAGDCNADGVVNIRDYMAAKRHMNGYTELSKTAYCFADIDKDGTLSADDLDAIGQSIQAGQTEDNEGD